MLRLRYRSASVSAVAAASILLGGAAASADEPQLTATMQCDRAAGPGRVTCSVEARAVGGRSIAWADVAIVDLPDFTGALKGRLGPDDVAVSGGASQRWAFALVARKPGDGEARVRVRAVVCEAHGGDAGPPRCGPTTIEVRALVHVG